MEPDGKQLAFTRYVEEKSQIFILSMEGGEPVQLTTFKYGANNPKWSPDGKKNILIKYFITRTTKDSILNKSYTVPTWTMENQGLKRMNI
jgi:Tol biopolymer transport system component